VLKVDKQVVELACTLLRFKRPASPHRTATYRLLAIFTFHLGVGLRQMLLLTELLAE